jgi:3-oxoacyl-[acyl-carrier protein] reductase
MGELDGKIALITGSSRGIGQAIGLLFARQGATVVVHGRDQDALRAVEQSIREAGGVALALAADVTDFRQIEAMRQSIEERAGPVDVLVANAGGSFTPPGPVEEIDEAGWRASIDGNLTATFLTIKSFLPGMKERRRGTIITMSSTSGRRAGERSPVPYAAAKAGIQLLTQDLAIQAGPYGIRANCIAPEAILTERNLAWIPTEQIDSLVAAHPVRRLGTPEDVARAALFLATDHSSWITGVVLDVTGGGFMA